MSSFLKRKKLKEEDGSAIYETFFLSANISSVISNKGLNAILNYICYKLLLFFGWQLCHKR